MSISASPRQEYSVFLEEAIERYKGTLSRSALLAIGDEAVRRLSTEPQVALTEIVLCAEVDRLVLDRLELPNFREWRRRKRVRLIPEQPFIGAFGSRLACSSQQATNLFVTARDVSHEMLLALAKSPDAIHSLSPRRFEQFVAEVLSRLGLSVLLTPSTRDGGRDIIAKISSPVGAFLCLIECKKYSPDRPVGVRPVRELFGVVSHERVNQGILVTTSDYTAPARQFAARVPNQISLKAYVDVVTWLNETARRIADRMPNPAAGRPMTTFAESRPAEVSSQVRAQRADVVQTTNSQQSLASSSTTVSYPSLSTNRRPKRG